jgi:hypothetical protein
MKKFTKAQKEAIEGLVIDLDELSNKPRRLVSSLVEFNNAFTKDKDEIDKNNLLYEELEEVFYGKHSVAWTMHNIFLASTDAKRELVKNARNNWGDEDEEKFLSGYEAGVKDAIKLFTKKSMEVIIEECIT